MKSAGFSPQYTHTERTKVKSIDLVKPPLPLRAEDTIGSGRDSHGKSLPL